MSMYLGQNLPEPGKITPRSKISKLNNPNIGGHQDEGEGKGRVKRSRKGSQRSPGKDRRRPTTRRKERGKKREVLTTNPVPSLPCNTSTAKKHSYFTNKKEPRGGMVIIVCNCGGRRT